jgi:hypothetical protein
LELAEFDEPPHPPATNKGKVVLRLSGKIAEKAHTGHHHWHLNSVNDCI